MVDRGEQERLMRTGGERLLMVMLATALWSFLSITKLVPGEEAVLLGWTVGFIVGYWLPPRPTISFVRWASERIIMLIVFYVVVLKTPPLVAPSLNRYVAYGIGFVLFLALYFAWTRHPKSTLRLGRA
jgi:hypothetical protein